MFDLKQRYGVTKGTCKCKHMGLGSSLCGSDRGCWNSGMSCIYLFSCSCLFIICLFDIFCVSNYLLWLIVVFFFGSQKKVATADASGSWQVSLDPVPAGGPYSIHPSLCSPFISPIPSAFPLYLFIFFFFLCFTLISLMLLRNSDHCNG